MFKKKTNKQKQLQLNSEEIKFKFCSVLFLHGIRIIDDFSSLLTVPENKYLINIQTKCCLG